MAMYLAKVNKKQVLACALLCPLYDSKDNGCPRQSSGGFDVCCRQWVATDHQCLQVREWAQQVAVNRREAVPAEVEDTQLHQLGNGWWQVRQAVAAEVHFLHRRGQVFSADGALQPAHAWAPDLFAKEVHALEVLALR